MTQEEREQAERVISAIFLASWVFASLGAGILWGPGGLFLVGGIVGVVFALAAEISDSHQ